ncbi:MAG: hypothetical protein QOD85_2138 [Gaiellaceae bacterium]|jgi:hypothetical protein|nr:hypothetical protein [Gaiellaceae bacterium]
MYTRVHTPTRVGVVTHHPLRSTLAPADQRVSVELVPIARTLG